jgi:glyoxylase-like metal-dependent hydrolase (beta-lactamase superfamily II)
MLFAPLLARLHPLRTLLALALAVWLALTPLRPAHAADATAAPVATPQAPVRFAIVKTGSRQVLEALMVSGGRVTYQVATNFSAFVIQHGNQTVLLDTGLGSRIGPQYRQDMPLWLRPMFTYEDPITPARQQLDQAGIGPIQTIYLSHSHWDHASGLDDFPEATVWLPATEMATVKPPLGGLGGAWPSQVGSPAIRWATLDFQPVPFEGFEASHDVYGDGTVVLVPLYGHTPGSVGMFVKVSSGKRYFFVGDAIWSARALLDASPKFWPARLLVDGNAGQTLQVIERIRAVVARHPDLVVLPAHDGVVQDVVGYFPKWVE